MRVSRLGTTVLAAALGIALAGASAVPAVAQEPSGTIKGTVTLDGSPLAGREVVLGGSGGTTSTGPDGTYEISVAPGRYWLRVQGPEDDRKVPDTALQYLETYSGDTVRFEDAVLVKVQGGETATMDIAAVPGAVLRGRVLGADGKPLRQVRVEVRGTTRGGLSYDRTGKDGRFRVHQLATGPVELELTHSSGAKTLTSTVTQGATTTLGDIVLEGLSRAGTVKATFERLRKGDRIVALDSRSGERVELARARKHGTLKLKATLPPGRYRLVADRANLASKEVRVRTGRSVSAGTLKAVRKRSTLSGVIKGSDGKPLADARARVSNRYGFEIRSMRTDAWGRYSFKNLGRGTYILEARAIHLGSSGKKELKVTLEAGKKNRQNVRLPKAYTVKGTVVHGGRPVEGIVVGAYTYTDHPFVTRVATDKKGRFTLRGVTRGKVQLRLEDPTAGGYLNRRTRITVPLEEPLVLKIRN